MSHDEAGERVPVSRLDRGISEGLIDIVVVEIIRAGPIVVHHGIHKFIG